MRGGDRSALAAQSGDPHQAQTEQCQGGWFRHVVRHGGRDLGAEVRCIVVMGVPGPHPARTAIDVALEAPWARSIRPKIADSRVAAIEADVVTLEIRRVGQQGLESVGEDVVGATERELTQQAGDAALIVGEDVQVVVLSSREGGVVHEAGRPVVTAAEASALRVVAGGYEHLVAIIDVQKRRQDRCRSGGGEECGSEKRGDQGFHVSSKVEVRQSKQIAFQK